MKIGKLILAMAVLSFTVMSCVEKSDKYKALLSERDSLLVVEQQYNQTLDVLNNVETGFQSIRDVENRIVAQMTDKEGTAQSKKQQLNSQIDQIKEILEQNKKQIAQLENQLAQSGRKNKSLAETIKRLEKELASKNALIESLQAELAKKNVKIEELAGTIVQLNQNITSLNETSANQQATIASQDSNLNTIWYCVGNAKELKTWQVVTGNGFLKRKSVMDKDFNKAAFTQADLREVKAIATGSKKPKVLSSHPKESYSLVPGEDKLVTLEITDPAKFWSVSKYLVIQK